MFQSGKYYKHRGMRDVAFRAYTVHEIVNGDYWLHVYWCHTFYKFTWFDLGLDQIRVKKEDIQHYAVLSNNLLSTS